jgi:MFS family permease
VAAYRRLLAAYTLNELAWSFGTLALSYLVYRRTGSAIGAAAFYVCAMFVPAFIAPAAVARLDRRPARTLLPALYAGEAVLYGLLAALTRHFTLAPVLVITLLDGVLALTARPLARATSVTVTSAEGLLREGNAIINVLFSVALMVGPAIGGAVVALGGITVALLVNVGLFLLIALVLVTATDLPAPEAESDDKPKGRVRGALAYTRGHRTTRVLFGVYAVGLIVFTISVPVEVVYTQHTLHVGAGGYGALLAAWGGGAVIGSAIYARWHDTPARTLLAIAALMATIGFTGLAVAPVLAVAIPFAIVAGVGNGVDGVAARTAIQEQTDSQWMALVMSFFEVINQVMPGLGIVLGGALAALGNARFAWAVAAAGALGVTAATWWLLRAPSGFHEPATDPPL